MVLFPHSEATTRCRMLRATASLQAISSVLKCSPSWLSSKHANLSLLDISDDCYANSKRTRPSPTGVNLYSSVQFPDPQRYQGQHRFQLDPQHE